MPILNVTETETHINEPIKDDVVLLSPQYWYCQMNSHESNLGEHKRTHITFRASASAAGQYFAVHSYCFPQAALIGRLSPPPVGLPGQVKEGSPGRMGDQPAMPAVVPG